jgi:Tfp pilus assembly protein PilO
MNQLQARFLALSDREQRLIVIALICAVAGLYLIQRYLPKMGEIQALQKDTTQLEASLRSLRIPKIVGVDTSSLEVANNAATMSLEEIEASLLPLEAEFASLKSPADMQGLMVSLSQLASETGVVIRESGPEAPTAARVAGSLANELVGGSLYERPSRRIVVEGTYTALRRFLNGLARLERRVVVLQFSMETSRRSDSSNGSPWLSSTVRVSL